ncbi:putative sensor domain DACNV-containing protein [Planctomicrobium sp. SH664]|uniref:putative sensor domain DACNV-containing protein n=1 Tax=Planctomicrobium sp. SH664 TaxID=3448125 RepID=UPI003F5CAD19
MSPSRSIYPDELSRGVRVQWQSAGHDLSLLPPEVELGQLFDAAYQASLLKEEGENVRCRIAVASYADFHSPGGPQPLSTLVFREKPVATAHEIRKLASAAGFYRSLLAVEWDNDGLPRIWGVINTGTRWVNRVDGGRMHESPLPDNLVVQIRNPGHLVIASGDQRVLETSGGILLTDGFDPFYSQWLPERFRSFRTSMLNSLPASGQGDTSTRICDSFLRSAAQSVIRRVIGLVRTRGHGGILVYIGDQGMEEMISHWFRFRILFQQGPGTWRYRDLIQRLMKRLLEIGRDTGMALVTWRDYQQMFDHALQDLDDALVEFAHLLADFMSVDGALVMDREFRVIGFGAEILGNSHVSVIQRALDLEANQTITERADTSGTRHRAAYRLVSGVQDVIALVVSQDGAVRFVAHHKNQLTYWPYVP